MREGATTVTRDVYGPTYTYYDETLFYLINDSSTACTLTGRPGLRLLGSAQQDQCSNGTLTCGYPDKTSPYKATVDYPAGPTPLVTVAPGESAMFRATYVYQGVCLESGPYQAQITLPDDAAPLTVISPELSCDTAFSITPIQP